MRQQNSVARSILFALGTLSCTPRTPVTPPLPLPTPQEVSLTTIPVRRLVLSPGNYQYRLTQTAEVIPNDSAGTANPSLVTTTALFRVDVSQQGDSGFSATVSIDSLRITSQGSIPQTGAALVQRIDSLLQAVLSPALITSYSHLPDSLCMYGSLISTARLILLPELPLEADPTSQKTYTNTAQEISCRAGARVESLTTRQLRKLGKEVSDFSLEERTDLNGAGLLRQDSVAISGSLLTRGTVSFSTESRLPSLILTNSEGTITVQLGAKRIVFRQTSKQEIRLENP